MRDALAVARETKVLEVSSGCLERVPATFNACFGDAAPLVIADENTYRAAGAQVQRYLLSAGCKPEVPFIFESRGLYAEQTYVTKLEAALSKTAAVPVAVGSGTLNDLCKLASHRAGRRYLAVPTAASMDGYTAFGASITVDGSKQTCPCPAPLAVVADLNIVSRAPEPMNSWGYADLLAKVTAGADWIVADALGVEPIVSTAWGIAQGRLAELIASPEAVVQCDNAAVARLTEGLMLSGFAMQATASSRPASGAEHQFSHLWDMQHHTHGGSAPSHGFKVGIGTLAVAALYETLFAMPVGDIDVQRCCEEWPSQAAWTQLARDWIKDPELAGIAEKELAAKHVSLAELTAQLQTLKGRWPELKARLQEQLLPLGELRRRLLAVNAPVEPEQIGISRERLRASYWQAFCIRRRFTVLDLAARTGLLDACLERIFGEHGTWPADGPTHDNKFNFRP